ncbi:MAG: FG-GAP-like repeat-containing protein [Terracidiphilus sp.]
MQSSAVSSATYTIDALAPSFSPPAGNYTSTQTVTISDSTTDATIYYTTNGTTPTTSSTMYSGPITVNSTETLEAIAVATGYSQSGVATATYIITPPAATTTTLAISSGGTKISTVESGTVVTLTATVTSNGSPVTTGQVLFCNALASYCTDINLLGAANLTGAGTATLKFYPGPGSYSYKAVFVGTRNSMQPYLTSTSADESLSVTGLASTSTSITASGSVGNYTLTATVVGSSDLATAPAGTVSFFDASNGNAAVGSALLGAGTQGLSFTNQSNPATDVRPISIAVGDFNGDGVLDLATANNGGSTVTILLGNGNGTFTANGTISLTGTIPYCIAAGDFNGDGKLDLAVADANSNNVTILLGNGNGTFTAQAASPLTGTHPFSIVVGDFNGDGIPDLAVANNASDNVTILVGKGDGTFTAQATSPSTGSSPYAIAADDFNGDGIPDLAVANQNSNNVTILLGNGDGTFTPAPQSLTTGSFPSSIAVGDFNGDGKLDLAVGNVNSNNLTILLGNGDGTFTTEATSPSTGGSPYFIAVGDFNGDGIPDLAVSNYTSNNLTILLGKGDGTFTAQATKPATGSGPISIALGDFNGDGTPDLAVPNLGSNTVTVLTSNLTETASATVTGIAIAGTGQHMVDASYPGDSLYAASVSGTTSLTSEAPAATPTFSVPAGTYTSAQTVTVSDTTVGATIYYTTNGTTPTTSSTMYSGPITVSSTETLEAIAVATGYSQSGVGSAAYTINLPAATPTFSPAAGTYTSVQKVTISDTTPNATIYYTTNGITPTTSSTVYSGPITVSSTETLEAIAVATGYSQSAMATGAYVINLPTPSFTISGTSVTVTPGATTANTSTITVTPAGGFTGNVALTAVFATSPSGAQYPPTLSFGSTTPVSISGTTAATATLTISTTAPTSAALEYPKRHGVPWYATGGATLACILLFGIPARRRRWQTMLGTFALFVALSGGLFACGGGGGGGGGGTGNPGTTAGAYTVTVTGTSGSTTASGTVTLTVE